MKKILSLLVLIVLPVAAFAHDWGHPRSHGYYSGGKHSVPVPTYPRGYVSAPVRVVPVRTVVVTTVQPSYTDSGYRQVEVYDGNGCQRTVRYPSCSSYSRSTVYGATGVVTGAVLDRHNRVRGGLIGGVVGLVFGRIADSHESNCQRDRVITAPDDLRDARSPEQLRSIYGPQGESLIRQDSQGW